MSTKPVIVYGKEGCKLCAAAKEKLTLMGVAFTSEELATAILPHDGWREDGTAELMAASVYYDTMPIIRIGEYCYNYPGAMKQLKGSGNG